MHEAQFIHRKTRNPSFGVQQHQLATVMAIESHAHLLEGFLVFDGVALAEGVMVQKSKTDLNLAPNESRGDPHMFSVPVPKAYLSGASVSVLLARNSNTE